MHLATVSLKSPVLWTERVQENLEFSLKVSSPHGYKKRWKTQSTCNFMCQNLGGEKKRNPERAADCPGHFKPISWFLGAWFMIFCIPGVRVAMLIIHHVSEESGLVHSRWPVPHWDNCLTLFLLSGSAGWDQDLLNSCKSHWPWESWKEWTCGLPASCACCWSAWTCLTPTVESMSDPWKSGVSPQINCSSKA